MHDLVHDLAASVLADELTTVDASQKSSSNTRKQKYCRYALLTNYDGQAKLSNTLPEKVRALHFASSSKLLASHEGSLSFAKCLIAYSGFKGMFWYNIVAVLHWPIEEAKLSYCSTSARYRTPRVKAPTRAVIM